MKLLLQVPTAIIVVLILATWIASLRLVVLPPGSFKLRAMTALVYQGHDYRLVDSPRAMCDRQAYQAKDCEEVAMNHLGKRVLFRLPYSNGSTTLPSPVLRHRTWRSKIRHCAAPSSSCGHMGSLAQRSGRLTHCHAQRVA
ncbi:hypothetical protein [Sinorhizobium sp. GL28]|uniref:hypothetical protein n=1 Tax=Sinorhizobium sp. GL28 TaxID=1358418 RepID=UPI00071C7116|nr:hypothetical protein [Sinorhizobium sp. GL28]KSV86585.1 hypothetical protein N184_10715 [Sinorhizobium sp. GL28]